jgi:cold shock CspA family protein
MEAVIIYPAIRADDFNALKESDHVPFGILQGPK